MSRLALPLSLIALALGVWSLLRPPEAGSAATAAAPSADLEALGRRITTRSRREARQEIQRHLQAIDERHERMETLRSEMQANLTDIGDWIDEMRRLSAGGLDEVKAQLQGMAKVPETLRGLADALETLTTRVKEVEDRPAVVREVVIEKQAPKPDPGPKRPTLPGKPTEDPTRVAAQVKDALEKLQSTKAEDLWPAIEVARKHKVLAAAPRLVEILGTHKDLLIRQNAATALGAMQSCDAVLPLADAIASDADLAQMAAKAILSITGFDPDLSHSARTKERRKARNEVVAWWRGNEEAVRTRLGQPKPE